VTANSGPYAVFLLGSTAAAMRGEKLLLRAGLEVKLIPVPREISSDCGISIRVGWDDREAALATLAEGRVKVDRVHRM
jgi:hypothetical protein